MSNPDDNKDPVLEQFTQHLTDSLPELPEEAMRRIKQAMHAEVRRVRRRRRIVQWTAVAALAASLLAAVGIPAIWRGAETKPGLGTEIEVAASEEPSETPPIVEDRFVVAVTIPDETTSASPLLRLDDYRSLIEDVN